MQNLNSMKTLKYLNEEWRGIKGYSYKGEYFDYSDLYAVSNYGRVKRLKSIVNSRYGKYHIIDEHIISQQLMNNGYLTCVLSKSSKVKRFFVNRLVAFAFPEICGEWFEKAEADHINTIRNDNRAINLKWKDKISNQQNPLSIIHRCVSQKKAKKRYGLSAKPTLQYTLDGLLIKEYHSATEAAKINGFNFKQISACCTGRHKTAYGYIWKYKE